MRELFFPHVFSYNVHSNQNITTFVDKEHKD